MEQGGFNQRLECAASKYWSDDTTHANNFTKNAI